MVKHTNKKGMKQLKNYFVFLQRTVINVLDLHYTLGFLQVICAEKIK